MKRLGSSVSYGHDCELSYLLINIVNELKLDDIRERTYQVVSEVLRNVMNNAFDLNGCLYNSANLETGETGNVHVWWAASEAVSAMLCGYDITGEERFLTACEKQIAFIEKYFVNRETGDWYNNIYSDETGGHLSDGQHGMDKMCIRDRLWTSMRLFRFSSRLSVMLALRISLPRSRDSLTSGLLPSN